ncbi:MAG: zinc ribbon domain-containing protein [Candidatus Asgardarchaeia archaeon]
MYRKLSLLFVGFTMLVIGILLLLIDSTSSTTFSGVIIIFPFVIFVGNHQSIPPLGLLVLSFIVILMFLVVPIILFKYAFNQFSFESDINTVSCPNCGSLVPSSYNYCPFCGYNLKLRKNDNLGFE